MDEKMNNNVKKNNGVVRRLPPGFRFQPTEEELVFQYLKCKVFSLPLPASVIPHLNLCNFDPWDLPGKCDEEDRYLFSLKEAKYRNGNRMNRTTVSGYWKATGSDKKVSCSSRNNYYNDEHDHNNNNNIRGIRKTLVFFQGISPNGNKTDWTMHEYRLVTTHHHHADSNINKEIGDWVLCRIFLKKRNTTTTTITTNKNIADDVADQPILLLYDLHSSMSSSCSSSSDHEESTAYSGF